MVMFKAYSLFICFFGFAVGADPTILERVAYVRALREDLRIFEIACRRSQIRANPDRFAQLGEDLLALYIRSEELPTGACTTCMEFKAEFETGNCSTVTELWTNVTGFKAALDQYYTDVINQFST